MPTNWIHPPEGTDRAQDPLQPDRNPAHHELLQNIQGNILNSHGRPFVRLVLFRFDGWAEDPSLRALLRDAVSDANADAVGTKWKITTAYQQWCDARTQAIDRPFYSLALTHHGLQRCGYTDRDLPLADSQVPSRATGFVASMNDPAVAQVLGDRVAPQHPPLPDWEEVYREGVDGVWLLANADPSLLDAMERRVTDFLKDHRASKVAVEIGFTWLDHGGNCREPFGFRDGISDPIFFYKDCLRSDPNDPTSVPWVPKWTNLPRSQVLIDWTNADGSSSEHNGGSFLVLRKLEQNVKAFRDTEQAIHLSYPPAASSTILPSQPGALLIGRERNGTPLASLSGPTHQIIDKTGPNRFDFGVDDTRCPFHAHIRKCAPRAPGPPSNPPPIPHRDTLDARQAIFVRRSSVYDPYGQLPPSRTITDDLTADPAIQAQSYQSRTGSDITHHVGLLFMGYMSNIIHQFQKLQSDWFGSTDFPFMDASAVDPIIRCDATQGSGWQWPTLPQANVALPPIVVPRGGAYFYVPSISWLRQQSTPPQALPAKVNPFVPELVSAHPPHYP